MSTLDNDFLASDGVKTPPEAKKSVYIYVNIFMAISTSSSVSPIVEFVFS